MQILVPYPQTKVSQELNWAQESACSWHIWGLPPKPPLASLVRGLELFAFSLASEGLLPLGVVLLSSAFSLLSSGFQP